MRTIENHVRRGPRVRARGLPRHFVCDEDGDGHDAVSCAGGDCDDQDADSSTTASDADCDDAESESTTVGSDSDCDGLVNDLTVHGIELITIAPGAFEMG